MVECFLNFKLPDFETEKQKNEFVNSFNHDMFDNTT